MKPALHVEGAILENDADEYEENKDGRKSLELVGIGRP